MTDTQNPTVSPKGPIPHDGWKSRKVVAGLAAAGTLFATATIALLVSGIAGLGFFSADQWITTQQTTVVPTVLITLGYLTAEKWAARGR